VVLAGTSDKLSQRAFQELGYLRLDGAFSASAAAGIREVAWQELASSHGVLEHDRSTWTVRRPRHWKRTKTVGARLMIGPAVAAALDELLGEGMWSPPDHWHVLVTFPSICGELTATATDRRAAEATRSGLDALPPATSSAAAPPASRQEWRLPPGLWHIDGPASTDASDVSEVKLFAVFGSVGSHGGGTLILPRSHHMLANWVAGAEPEVLAGAKRMRARFMAHAPWLKALASPTDGDPKRNARFMEADGDVNGIPARVVELTGEPGDVVLCHPMLLHCVAPNTADEPRFMRTATIKRRPA
jgi:hypothetical protein